MANADHLKILERGVKHWNSWREKNPELKPDLRRARLEGSQLDSIDLSNADLRGANLSGGRFRYSYFTGARLSGANLRGSDLVRALFDGADLSKADLHQADLQSSGLFGASLEGAQLDGALLCGTWAPGLIAPFSRFRNANLDDSNLGAAILFKADLDGAHLSRTDLLRGDLRGATLRNAKLFDANLNGANLAGADLRGADLSRAHMIHTTLTRAHLEGCRVYGVSTWDLKGRPKSQEGLIITPPSRAPVTVDDLQVAQFIYLLLNYRNIRDAINTMGKRCVLILGRFGGGGLEVLHAIAARLRKMNYLPIIFDFERPRTRDYTETVQTLVGLSRFVIVDLSGRSVPQELYATVPHFEVPFAPIIEKRRRAHATAKDLRKYSWFMPTVEFARVEELIEMIPSKIVTPAEEKNEERQKRLETA